MLTVQSPDGERGFDTEEADPDFDFTVSESGFSEFRTIKTVTDFGLVQYAPEQVRKYSFPERNARESSESPSQGTGSRRGSYNASTPTEHSHIGAHLSTEEDDTSRATEEAFDDSLDADHQEEYSVENVSSQLWNAMMTAKYCGETKPFLPQDKLFSIVNDLAIQCILRETFSMEPERANDERHDQICGDEHQTSRRMVFTILVMEDQVKHIDDFISNKIYDINLPISWEGSNGNNSIRVRRTKGSESNTKSSFPNWKVKHLRRFCDDQYHVITPFLHVSNKEVYFYKMEPQIRLPFTDWELKKKGGYGAISRVKIHKAHHGFSSSTSAMKSDAEPVFAVKSVFTTDFERYAKEVSVLQRFSGSQRGHPHLVRLLMAFKHGMRLHLLFPWASGNLFDLWQKYQNPKQSSETVRWLIDQCSGLAGGLAKVHHHDSWPLDHNGRQDQLGRHGDIKPLNILWFEKFDGPTHQQKDHLVIADFGLTIFHSSSGNTEPTAANRLKGCSRTYRPPEVDLGDGRILQRYDVWSLACLYLEFLTWYLLGFKKTYNETPGSDPVTFADHRILGDETDEDKFFTIRPDSGSNGGAHEAVVKPQVKKWISQLRDLENCPQCLVDFLDYIQSRMLLPVDFQRADMKDVNSQLAKIKDRCETSPDYCVGRGPSILGGSARNSEEDSITIDGDAEEESASDLFDLSELDEDDELDKAIYEQLQLSEPMSTVEEEDNGDDGVDSSGTAHLPTRSFLYPDSGQHALDRSPRRTTRHNNIIPHLDTEPTTSTFERSQLYTPADSRVTTTPNTTQYFDDELHAEDQIDGRDAPTTSRCASSVGNCSSLSLSTSPGTQQAPAPETVSANQTTSAAPPASHVNFYGEPNMIAEGSRRLQPQNNRRKRMRKRYEGKAKRILKRVWDRFKTRVENYFSDDESLLRRSTCTSNA
ncbi:hypothetical protein PG993_008440 [Apiospora rasikravindrae]|uniref:Protein kinase domain-containing protein n=1 Tax=Apiospora rasikravindrae TaxID=990691 RepID=A0ABR1T0C3_9PEZI